MAARENSPMKVSTSVCCSGVQNGNIDLLAFKRVCQVDLDAGKVSEGIRCRSHERLKLAPGLCHEPVTAAVALMADKPSTKRSLVFTETHTDRQTLLKATRIVLEETLLPLTEVLAHDVGPDAPELGLDSLYGQTRSPHSRGIEQALIFLKLDRVGGQAADRPLEPVSTGCQDALSGVIDQVLTCHIVQTQAPDGGEVGSNACSDDAKLLFRVVKLLLGLRLVKDGELHQTNLMHHHPIQEGVEGSHQLSVSFVGPGVPRLVC